MNRKAVSFQSVGQFRRVAQRDQVATVDRVDLHPEPLTGDPALKVEREHPVVAAGQYSGRDVGPGGQRPRHIERRHRLVLPRSRLRFDSERGRQVVIVDDGVVGLGRRQSKAGVILVPRLSRVRVRPPRVEGLSGERDHRVEQDQQAHSMPSADDRRGKSAHRRGDEDDVGAIADGIDDGVRVLEPAGRIVLGRQPDRDHRLSARGELGREPMPFPGIAAPTGDQDIGSQ